jgi:hypothetical protein
MFGEVCRGGISRPSSRAFRAFTPVFAGYLGFADNKRKGCGAWQAAPAIDRMGADHLFPTSSIRPTV